MIYGYEAEYASTDSTWSRKKDCCILALYITGSYVFLFQYHYIQYHKTKYFSI